MNTYKVVNQENGDILLEKIVIDKDKYLRIHIDNGNILLRKVSQNVTIKNITDLSFYNFKKSIITQCIINSENFDQLNYRHIMNEIYRIIGDGTTIIRGSVMHLKTFKKTDQGFYYLPRLGISCQSSNGDKCLHEIFTQCMINGISLHMEITTFDSINVTIDL